MLRCSASCVMSRKEKGNTWGGGQICSGERERRVEESFVWVWMRGASRILLGGIFAVQRQVVIGYPSVLAVHRILCRFFPSLRDTR